MRQLVILVTIVLGYGLGVLFYARGFLLTRQTLQDVSTCSDIQTEVESNACWIAPAYKRVVILLVDALRFVFSIRRLLIQSSKMNRTKDAIKQTRYKQECLCFN